MQIDRFFGDGRQLVTDKSQVAQYAGSENPRYASRSLTMCEALWNADTVKPGTFDEMLAFQLKLAIAEGRDVVTVLDLGSGETSALLKNIINNSVPSSPLTQTRALLAQNPPLNIRFIGLTDAKTDANFFRRDAITFSPLALPAPGQFQMSAENVHFSLNPEQTLVEFARGLGVKDFNLVLATGFFTHFYPEDFEQILEAVVLLLHENGGKLVAAVYAGDLPPVTRDDRDYAKQLAEAFELTTEYLNNVLGFFDKALDYERGNEIADEKQAIAQLLAEELDIPLETFVGSNVIIVERKLGEKQSI